MKYDVKITGIGPEALEFLGPELDLNFVIIFNDDALADTKVQLDSTTVRTAPKR